MALTFKQIKGTLRHPFDGAIKSSDDLVIVVFRSHSKMANGDVVLWVNPLTSQYNVPTTTAPEASRFEVVAECYTRANDFLRALHLSYSANITK